MVEQRMTRRKRETCGAWRLPWVVTADGIWALIGLYLVLGSWWFRPG
ncbi:hypothetical protein E1A91_A08G052600v1 [Gossypium mustelinum]|uniref:Uncharacterized protein n=1 Tax=Gossypium mustelinum TaxID=34275 RepID=A0A5D2Y4X9_GOSMU|nr:hypothetical protein E1A91_A08G052600v1 [Gossypium mustelinum]